MSTLEGDSPYRDDVVRARLAQGALVLDALSSLALAAVSPVSPPLYIEGVSEAVEAFWDVALPLMMMLRLLTASAFLAWVHRASQNAHALATEPLQHSTGAAIGYWFIPCGNLWLPYQVLAEIDRASEPESLGRTSGLVALWWCGWVVASVLGRADVGLVGVGARVAAAVLAILVVERIHQNQRESASRRDARAIAETFV